MGQQGDQRLEGALSAQGPAVIAFAAPSGTGKTTLLCKLIEVLRARGLRVGALKSDAHRVELDTPGKDTHRMRSAGSLRTAIVARDQVAFFRDGEEERDDVPVEEIVRLFFGGLDLVLAEGFRERGLPTVLLQRTAVSQEGWQAPENVIALVSDGAPGEAPWFGLDDVERLADFLVEQAATQSR